MDNEIQSNVIKKPFYKNARLINNKIRIEEKKNTSENPRDQHLHNVTLFKNYNNDIPIPQRKKNLFSIIPQNNNLYKQHNYSNLNNTNFQNIDKSNENTLINNTINNKNWLNHTNKVFEKCPSVCNMVNNRIKKINTYKCLNKNRSNEELINRDFTILPLIRPRKIIINYCCGPYELKVTDINKKNFNYKKYGFNTYFMGDKYNPRNYEIKRDNKLNRNYYGKIFSF